FGMHLADGPVRRAGQEGHERPALSRPPQPRKGEQWRFMLWRQAEPDLLLTAGFPGPFAEGGDGHDAPPRRLLQGIAPERARKIANVGDRSRSGRWRPGKSPFHPLEL